MCRRFSEKKFDINFNSNSLKNLKFKNGRKSADEKNNIQKKNCKKYSFKKKFRNKSEIFENRKNNDFLENKLNIIDVLVIKKYKTNNQKNLINLI